MQTLAIFNKDYTAKKLKNWHNFAKKGKIQILFGNPGDKIWQPCQSNHVVNVTSRFLVTKNMGVDTKIMFVGQLYPKLWSKMLKIALFWRFLIFFFGRKNENFEKTKKTFSVLIEWIMWLNF